MLAILKYLSTLSVLLYQKKNDINLIFTKIEKILLLNIIKISENASVRKSLKFSKLFKLATRILKSQSKKANFW